ncbi:hypothetical protein EG834_22645, partial [bacterium]|nr:hypothetical protein [bacterium]
MKHIRTIIGKEWMEVFKNKMVLFTTALMPILFTALPLIIVKVTSGSVTAGGSNSDVPALFAQVCG